MSLTFVNKTGHITSYSNLGRLLILLGILILGLVVAGFLAGPGYLLYAYYRVAHGPMTLKDTAHLDLYYLSGPTSERKVEALASDLERSYQALHRILGREPESRPTLFLLPETGISRPYPLLALATLREDEDDLGAGTRALATLFLRRPARGNDCLREGAAAYLQGRIRAHRGGFPFFGEELHRHTLGLKRRGDYIPLRTLFYEPFAAPGERRRLLQFQECGSFSGFLIESYGLANFLDLYHRGVEELPQVYGRGITIIEEDWWRMIK